ncbi:hypothetical protein HNW77_06455 [Komagataeibacter sp. AV436]|uniref:Uncharacterized protein n=1 Tax=Komagataeibacter melomenusus TaxID=2766578 RepID=A0ABX2AE52_9PROT|nr:hypothetical protein [Komagataeibacter melomenusus]MBV1830533.1 hypothetical protein [Komagataeibacter melomenusus]NPC66035.1 hypothetical protein [Komagataeibacter melomenusus]
MNELEIKLAAAKNRRHDVLKALDEVGAKQRKAGALLERLKAEKESLSEVQEQVNNIRLDAMEAGETTIYLPAALSRQYERVQEIDTLLAAATKRAQSLSAERAVTDAAMQDADEAIRKEAGAILSAEQADVWERAKSLWAEYLEAVRETHALGATGRAGITWNTISGNLSQLTPSAFEALNGAGNLKTDKAREQVQQRFADLIAPVDPA